MLPTTEDANTHLWRCSTKVATCSILSPEANDVIHKVCWLHFWNVSGFRKGQAHRTADGNIDTLPPYLPGLWSHISLSPLTHTHTCIWCHSPYVHPLYHAWRGASHTHHKCSKVQNQHGAQRGAQVVVRFIPGHNTSRHIIFHLTTSAKAERQRGAGTIKTKS